jgi:hypothetical protein
MWYARFLVVVVGIALPFAMRIPGVLWHGLPWLTTYLDAVASFLLPFQLANAISWSAILLATFLFKQPRTIWFPALLGFALPAFTYSTVDLTSDSLASVAFVFAPILFRAIDRTRRDAWIGV